MKKAIRGEILHFISDPSMGFETDSYEYYEDGLMLIDDGYVVQVGSASELLNSLSKDVELIDHTGKLIIPGFVDTHIHYVQTDVIASFGTRLLEWLEKYTFPAERQFEDPEHAQKISHFFIDELLRNGTTSALILGSVHKQSVNAIFQAAQEKNMRMIAGKVMMDRNCPDYLRDTPESSYDDSKALIEQWHNKDRLLYAVTPRFAPTSTEAQLKMAGKLVEEHPNVFMHTHLAENKEEVAWVADLFPDSRSYLDVYDKYGLLRQRSVLAHSIWLDEQDRLRMADTGAAIAHCPTCNLFIGSGYFDINEAREQGIRVGMGTDVGGGTTFNMLQVLNEAYKVAQFRQYNLPALRAFYFATLGGAESLYIDDNVGNFEKGKEADFLVLDYAATPLLERRLSVAENIEEKLFALMMLGDDRVVEHTYIMGEKAYSKIKQ